MFYFMFCIVYWVIIWNLCFKWVCSDNDINADGDVLSSDHDSDLEHGSEAQVNAHMTAKQQVRIKK